MSIISDLRVLLVDGISSVVGSLSGSMSVVAAKEAPEAIVTSVVMVELCVDSSSAVASG